MKNHSFENSLKPHHTNNHPVSAAPVKRKAVPAFTFDSLEVNNIGAEDVMDSSQAFSYIEGTRNPSVVIQYNNVFDPNVDSAITTKMFTEASGFNLSNNDDEIKYQLATSLTSRASSAIKQNIQAIYYNGFFAFIKNFIIPGKEEKFYGFPGVTTMSSNIYIDSHALFSNDYYNPKPYGDIESKDEKRKIAGNNDLMSNAMKCMFDIESSISSQYSRLILTILSHDDIFDIDAIAKYVDSTINTSLEKSQYIGMINVALNKIAYGDIMKIKEIIEIEIMQAIAMYKDLTSTNGYNE